ncbi:isoprenylcysteine carboxylmethyltransferase family protein [Bellilinea sp.]|uniref:methyltransferase family protein n=1 Tax=Bellilinea sp. TaxID=2838785 RepID=UPI002ADDB784|nr:isoprenylcysteine carboxylmethyltransferase family protein [Bellilinea sp.]
MTPAFWLILLSMFFYGALHSLLASRRVKRWAEARFGVQIRRYYRLFFSILGAVTFLPPLALTALLPDRVIYTIPFPWFLLTGLLQIAGAVGLLYGVAQTGAMRFIGLDTVMDQAALDRPPHFVTGGLYRWVRHPLYTCSLLFLWLMPVMSWNLLALNIGVTLYFIIGSRFEEDKLLDEFGKAYAEYRRRTPAFLPRLFRPPE